MSTSPPSPPGDHEPGGPSFAEENAMRVASESLIHYDAGSDTYHCSYGPPIPAITINKPINHDFICIPSSHVFNAAPRISSTANDHFGSFSPLGNH